MYKRIFACVLMMSLCLALFSGCGNREAYDYSENAGNMPSSAKTSTGAGKEDDRVNDGSNESENENAQADGRERNINDSIDMAEIVVVFPSMGALPTGLQAVEDEINNITENEINTHVTLTMIESGSYDRQIGLMMSSNETADLLMTMPSGASSYTNMQAQGQLSEISDLLDAYGADIKELLGDFVRGTTISGSLYGVTGYRNLACSEYIVMRTDVLEDLGLMEKARNMTSLAEYEEILRAVKNSEKWSYLSGLVSTNPGECMAQESDYIGAGTFLDMTCYDTLGDRNRMISIDPDGDSTVVRLNYETEEYRQMYEIMRDWYEKGYVYKDAATTTDMGQTIVKSDAAFSFFSNSELGIESAKSAACGMDMTCVKIIDQPITTGSCTKFVWTVPSTAREPEAAMTFLNMMYTDERICNLLAWGIENVDYEVVDGVAKYIEGNETPAYHTNDFVYGNQFLILPWEGMAKDIREQSLEATRNCELSAYLGFSCDTSSVTSELSAIINVISQYRPQVETGMADEAVYNEFLDKLKATGAEKIVDCYQKQLDAWLEENK